ncbi:DUF1852 domain-containing protein [Pseudomonas sp. PLB05]|jgi:hypothetical protein|uniref:DUF1852 domain-containing protein n=1 Tax=Pseudomonas sp. PLB05 TaxID=2899078 RepID=UPI001E542E77|nr:DUF1852 domain-containing protein [Pseudomonas sp. PLB05]MCD4863765.1 DUF1852 domain-containing protein [Pseudomonas sp. PLB05]
MSHNFDYLIKKTPFDERYRPSKNTRITTNFANLARGDNRQENLRNTLKMMNNRFNSLADWDNPQGDRYSIELDIISVAVRLDRTGGEATIPLIEILKTNILDRHAEERIEGVAGNNFSSYVRDYDFSILLSEHNRDREGFSTPENFGELHGKLFKDFVGSSAYKANFSKPPIVCLSVSTSRLYQRTENQHPVLGLEYRQDEYSLTDEYFAKMGLKVRYFMPPNSVAPLAFYFSGDLLNDYTHLELISVISTMDTFQKIYRPEIYNANSVAGHLYRPSLRHQDYSLTRILYDREERSQLAIEQGKFTEEHFIRPYRFLLEQWSATSSF